jgi:hypothetical protein
MTLDEKLNSLVQRLAKLDGVVAIGLSGGNRPLPSPGVGDIDLFLYCERVPDAGARKLLLSGLGDLIEHPKSEAGDSAHWGKMDYALLDGVETWMMYFTVDAALAEIDETISGKYLGRSDRYYYPIARCAMLLNMRSLHDPFGVLAGFRKKLEQYPEDLAKVQINGHLEQLADTEDLERAVGRGDLLFYHFALDLALDDFVLALFALNRTYFPSRKRSFEYIRGFETKPERCEERLMEVVQSGGGSDTLRDSLKKWTALVDELLRLAGGQGYTC